ncbi:hypothetical protein GCM10009038_16540 [Salinicola rhizosphaerae]|uniref:Uncharacterized protein n=2 Tax=Salinicola rhizosphaerae TaxID=1443141 RepID=A0ABQ3DZ05_9GAMM|nr:hypothetical protein GCM10009038_16540 [Salinicola rhizosphaerae]
MRKYRFTSVAVFCLLLLFILHLTGFVALKTELFLSTASTAFISCSLAYIFLTGVATGGIFLINVTARQKRYRGEEFANALGVSHTLSAILFAVGSWIGLTLNVEKDPAIALLLAALITAIPLFAINRKDTLRHEGN